MHTPILRNVTLAGIFFLALVSRSAMAQDFDVTAQLSCSAISGEGVAQPFSTVVSFKISNDRISGIRPTSSRPGREVYSGTIDSTGNVKIWGRGGYYNSQYSWTSSFAGAVKHGELTRVRGVLRTVRGGKRDCVIVVLQVPAELAARFDPQTKKLQNTATEKVEQPKAAPDTNKEGQNVASQEDKKAKSEAHDLKLQQQLLDAQRELKETQAQLARQQVSTKDQVKWIQNVLGGIILPPNEDPNSWMLRVAAVPVQQQQFCRIVDQFFDRLADVYKTQNEIKRNALYRDRRFSLAALLPHGEFQNWVVQIKEVTQASDGSAAVMLQPPCRAMLGSDACQKNGSKIRATIPSSSILFRELERVSAGDFVVVSGKLLYAEVTETDQLSLSRAIYQAGSHCSAASEGKQLDVFVTDINYLVQLR